MKYAKVIRNHYVKIDKPVKINSLTRSQGGKQLGLVVRWLESVLDLKNGQNEGDRTLGRATLDHGDESGGQVLAGEELDVGNQDALGRCQGAGHVAGHVYRVGQTEATTLGAVRGGTLELRGRAICRGTLRQGRRMVTRKYEVDGDLE